MRPQKVTISYAPVAPESPSPESGEDSPKLARVLSVRKANSYDTIQLLDDDEAFGEG